MQVQHQYDGGTGGVIVPGVLATVTEEWTREVQPGVFVSRHEQIDIELIDTWHLETRDQGIIADLRTGAVRPSLTSTHILHPRRENGTPLSDGEKARNRVLALAMHEARRHFPVHGIIGAANVEWRKPEPRAEALRYRAEWERSLLKPENLAAFVKIYTPLISLGWERLDFDPILKRLERHMDRARERGHAAKVQQLQRAMERATADLLCIRTLYTAIIQDDMPCAEAAWKVLSEVIPAEWVKREYQPNATFADLQQMALDPPTGQGSAPSAEPTV